MSPCLPTTEYMRIDEAKVVQWESGWVLSDHITLDSTLSLIASTPFSALSYYTTACTGDQVWF